VKAPRAKGNRREDIVAAMLDDRGRYAVVLRGSGSRGTVQQKARWRVAGDVIAIAERGGDVGLQIACGGPGKRPGAEFADLRDGAIPEYALVMCEFAGMKPRRWLLADDDGGWTECADLDDLFHTVQGRA
jgi:hypothetical protein